MQFWFPTIELVDMVYNVALQTNSFKHKDDMYKQHHNICVQRIYAYDKRIDVITNDKSQDWDEPSGKVLGLDAQVTISSRMT